jgi:AcrR family transcriptional regulator
VSPYHHGDLRRALIDAALDLVAENGPKGFSLTEAARRAGVSAAAPYRHFASKDDLLAAVAEQGFDQLHASLSEVEEADPATRLVALGVAYVRWAVAHGAQYQVMFGTGSKRPEDVGWMRAGERAFAVLTGAIADAQAAGVIRAGGVLEFATPIWALLHGLASLRVGGDLGHVGITEPVDAVAARAVAALLASFAC